MNILFLNVGRRCELIEAFRKALVPRGGRILGSDIDPYAPGLQKVDDHFLHPRSGEAGFIDALCDFCNAQDVDLLIPTIDPDLANLSNQREEIARRCPDLRLLLSPPETIQLSADKRLTRERFAACGAHVPQPVDPDDPALQFPIFMKPAAGSASKGIHLINDRNELAVFRDGCIDPMFERVVTGPETTVDVLCDFDSNALIALPRRRLAVRGGEVSRGLLERNPQLEELAKRLATAFDCMGPVTIQFRQPEADVYVAMEINARMGGGLPLSIAAGANWPAWILDLCEGKRPNTDVPIADGMIMSRFDSSVFIQPPPKPIVDHDLCDFAAVIFDLDDTLYMERDYVYAGYRAVAERVFADHGVEVEIKLRALFDSGVRNDIFGRVLRDANLDVSETYIRELVQLYRLNDAPLKPCVDIALLDHLRSRAIKVGLLTDGPLPVQRGKVERLGIAQKFDAIIYTDAIGGRDTWKPSHTPFKQCLAELGVDASDAVYIGDNPAKDFLGARQLGMTTIRIRRPGAEHTDAAPPTPDHDADNEVTDLTNLL